MDALNVCLIGHRGVGKTSFLKRVTSRVTFDLDDEIARRTGRTLVDIFATEGEAGFRAHERRCLAELLADPRPKLIAVGAGFDGEKPDAFCLWLRRETDAAGRIFLNRPRLNPSVDPLAEYLERFPARERRYRAWADRTLTVPEGYDGGLEDVLDGEWHVPFDVTYRPGRPPWWRARRVEVRDDLGTVVDPIDRPILHAYRTSGSKLIQVAGGAAAEEDWALELGPAPRRFAIVSVHAGDVTAGIARLTDADAAVRKLAVEVRTFAELMVGHRWWLKDPNGRAFLPRSVDGRWRWYRSLFGPRMPLHFVREDEGTALDQPLLWQTRLQTQFERTFAAVLGSPVGHSRTPIEHRRFFAARRMPVVAIDVTADEWADALPILIELGLTHAAVTAPLKALAFAAVDVATPAATRLRSVNTLHFGSRRRGDNTDVGALVDLRDRLPKAATAWLWGGGGVKSSVREAWPGIVEISARAGVDANPRSRPDLVIWATGRSREFRWPPPGVRPRLVLDLNYAEDSPGLEWAATNDLTYRSGLTMFELQAEAQREFWRSMEKEVEHARQSIW